MSDWYPVQSDSRTDEFDSTSSKFYVYQRKNFRRNGDFWLYDERRLSFKEFYSLRISQLEIENTDLQLALTDLYERTVIENG